MSGLYAEPDPGALTVLNWPRAPRGFNDVPMMAVECRPLNIVYWIGRCQLDGNRPPLAFDEDGDAYLVTYADAACDTECAVSHGLTVR